MIKDLLINNINDFQGEIFTDLYHLLPYATDASVYKETPIAIAYPKNENDVALIIKFAHSHNIPIICRGTGTSLAGQVVGKGIIVDFSRYMNSIIEINEKAHYVWVQPGVILDELNNYLKDFKLFFAPETSTANRCTLGGMVGNNACGAHSLIYGSTRDYLLEIQGFLSDGTYVHFKPLNYDEFAQKLTLNNREGEVYRKINEIFTNPLLKEQILTQYPDASIKRRNTGYALDNLLEQSFFYTHSKFFNFCPLIAGSEGTLMIITRIKLKLLTLTEKITGLVAAHYHTLEDAIKANLIALKLQPDAIELIDEVIIQCTQNNLEQQRNRFFIKDKPGAILLIEFSDISKDKIISKVAMLEKKMLENNLGYHFPVFFEEDIKKIWSLRKAALGLLTNIPGDAKPVSLIEDNAIPVEKLFDYIQEFKSLLAQYNLSCVFHAHIATGELHIRPVINLKTLKGQKLFRTIAEKTALLVKKYNGSISGEHGDGRLRSEFIPIIIGYENYQLCKEIKYTWDPTNILNPGKIVDPVPMDSALRYSSNKNTPDFTTYFDFSSTMGFVRHIEQCNGSADCRKSAQIGGIMCPTYMATHDELMTTRARANLIREKFVAMNEKAFFDEEIYKILDNCISCKGCKLECPSNIDMTKIKAEFLQRYYKKYKPSLRTILFANIPYIYQIASYNPFIFNALINSFISKFFLNIMGITTKRKMPLLSSTTVFKWYNKHYNNIITDNRKPIIWLFVDEFTNYLEAEIGIDAVKLFDKLGFSVKLLPIIISARSFLSKGFIKSAQNIIQKNLSAIRKYWNYEPIVGLEPSAVLTLRDEYIELAGEKYKEFSKIVSKYVFTFEEFIAKVKQEKPHIQGFFTNNKQKIVVHTHCYQKVLTNVNSVKECLSVAKNYEVILLNTGCCGMGGSFGYEKEHYDLSIKIGELSVFPAVRNYKNEIFVAPGISCRNHIQSVTHVNCYNSIQLLYNSLV